MDSALFSAVSSSARQLFLLLRCINFTNKVQVQITSEGLRFSVEFARTVQGLAFLDKGLFTIFRYNSPGEDEMNEQLQDAELGAPTFQISLPSFLETLSIFGSAETREYPSRESNYTGGFNGSYATGGGSSAFDNRVLGMSGLCRLSYNAVGEPLSITLEEGNVTTTCELVTYEPETVEDIPFDRDSLALKIIMRASLLLDAINELSSTSPERLTMAANPFSTPHFSLSTVGSLGSATVDFTKDPQLLETFQCQHRSTNIYKFSAIKHATRAMAIASKVSIRGDAQGVLSLQFMIDVDNGGVSFVDFRFVPFLPEDEDEEGDIDSEEDDLGGEQTQQSSHVME